MLQALTRWKGSILLVSGLLAVGLFASRHLVGPQTGAGAPAGPIPVQEAADYVGERAEVCGEVAEVTWIEEIDGKPTFINIGGKHPEQPFTALIWNEERPRWDPAPEDQYAGRTICVTGTVRLHQGTPEVVVSSPRQIRFR